ncbi:MAG: TIGR02281 family clan AA aspartic protease [Pseudomonadota bacterium]
MNDQLFGAALCVGLIVGAVKYFEANKNAEPESLPVAETVAPTAHNVFAREVRIRQGVHNQYFVSARVNNRPASFLVDTGASYVALRETDARNSGIYPRADEYKHPVQTANGVTHAAFVTIDAIEIDSIIVHSVQTFILPDEQLATNLLGMSFLSELQSVEARNGELVLKG